MKIQIKEVERTRQRGHLRKTWLDSVKDDMKSFCLACEDAQDKDDWRLRIWRATS